ncbi:hypothetical protein COEX109129_39160 [Corallococcus exiguus]
MRPASSLRRSTLERTYVSAMAWSVVVAITGSGPSRVRLSTPVPAPFSPMRSVRCSSSTTASFERRITWKRVPGRACSSVTNSSTSCGARASVWAPVPTVPLSTTRPSGPHSVYAPSAFATSVSGRSSHSVGTFSRSTWSVSPPQAYEAPPHHGTAARSGPG